MLNWNGLPLFVTIGSFVWVMSPLLAPAETASAKPDDDIRQILLNESKAAYKGSCRCPYDTAPSGGKCGDNSDYSLPGGEVPLCYPKDVTQSAVDAYRAAHGPAAK